MGVIKDNYTKNSVSDSRYFVWLGKKVGMGADHSKLMKMLGTIEFKWKLPLDENRAFDGLKLRNEYTGKGGIISKDLAELGCSVLEMLVGLSVRIERDLMGTPGDDHPERWFWEMLENLGVAEQNDDDFDNIFVSKVVTNWMFGAGKDNIFVLKQHGKEFKNLQIWDQMMAYLNENYVIED